PPSHPYTPPPPPHSTPFPYTTLFRSEQIRAAPGAIPHVVPHEVRDHRRVAGIVLRDPRLDLAHQVGAHVGGLGVDAAAELGEQRDRKSTRLNSSHVSISYAVFCLKKK